MKKKQMMKINNKWKIPDASGIFATVSQKFKKEKSFRFRNKSMAYFYGNFLSTFNKYKNYTKSNLKWLKVKNKANKRKKVRECLT